MGVSIITSYYNREDHVTESIQSLLDQTHEEFEILAIDDGSTDNTYMKLQEFNDPRLKVISHENMGIVKSFRKAINLAQYDYIAIHGSGDISFPNRIKKQSDFLDQHSDIGLVTCNVENYSMLDHSTRILKFEIDSENRMTQKLLKKNYFTQGEVMFRKDVYEKVGGYREFFTYAQDRDLWLRMSLETKFAKVDEVLYRRYLLADGVSGSPQKRFLQTIYSSFAVDCLLERINTGEDFLDKYKELGTLYINKKRLDKGLVYLSLIYFFQRDLNSSEWVVKNAIRSTRTLRNTLLNLLIMVSKRSTLIMNSVIKVLDIIKNSENTKMNLVEIFRK
jgi:glycosyltransferase involved in cell wall biosynthesis